jgi:glycosyltransferase involved in cell wall biosynthesis
MRRLSYLCLQVTEEGQASYAHVHEIIAGLRHRGWNVMLFEPRKRKRAGSWSLLFKGLDFCSTQLSLWCAARPDVIYIRWHFATWPTALWARMLRIPVVQEVNGPYEDLFIAWPWTRRLAPFFKGLMRKQLSWASEVIAVTPHLARWVRGESGNSRVRVIPNGVNTELFRPDAPSSIRLPEAFVVFFGALAPWQGVSTMLKAVEESEWPSPVKLVVVGDGAERHRVESAASCQKIVYLGKVRYAEIPGIVARSIAGLSPQTSCGGRSATGLFPLKVFETLGCGVPVIVSDFPGQADLVRRGKCGIVVEPENPTALAEAVAYLYHHPESRMEMGRRGRRLVEREHQWDMRAGETATVLEDALGQRRSDH